MGIQGGKIAEVSGFLADVHDPSCRKIDPVSRSNGLPSTKESSTGSKGHADMLAMIKHRIQSGYYNSESVIDDIGYGFAQVFSNTF